MVNVDTIRPAGLDRKAGPPGNSWTTGTTGRPCPGICCGRRHHRDAAVWSSTRELCTSVLEVIAGTMRGGRPL